MSYLTEKDLTQIGLALNDELIFFSKQDDDANLILISGNCRSTYRYLQNVTRFKAELLRRGLTFQPLARVTEQDAFVRIKKRGE